MKQIIVEIARNFMLKECEIFNDAIIYLSVSKSFLSILFLLDL